MIYRTTDNALRYHLYRLWATSPEMLFKTYHVCNNTVNVGNILFSQKIFYKKAALFFKAAF